MRSFFSMFICAVPVAAAATMGGSCPDGNCEQDESTLLQMASVRQHHHRANASVPNEGTQCWHSHQCNHQGGECPSGYCGVTGVCCRNNWQALNAAEEEYCSANGYGNDGMHQCHPSQLVYQDVQDLPRTWTSAEASFGVEVLLDPPRTVGSVTVVSDWWMKRPDVMAVYVTDQTGVTHKIAEFEYGGSLDICSGGRGPCSYPDDGSGSDDSQRTVGIHSDVVASSVRVQVVTPRNAHGQPNGQVIIKDVRVNPPLVAAEGKKCPLQHSDRLFRSPESGSSPITLVECFELCQSTDGCNHYSWGPWEGENVCMGCTSLTNAEEHEPFTAYDMPDLTRYTIDGCGRDGAEDFPLTGHNDPTATADVRCCSLDGTSGFSQGFAGGEDFFRNDALHSQGCMFSKTFLEARAICAADNKRLCAPHEIDVTCGSGCWHNHNAVWVETPTVGVTVDGCSSDNINSSPDDFPGSDTSGQTIEAAQKSIGDTAAVRCCSLTGNSCASTVNEECNDAVTFVDAQKLCSADGKRLCSASEMNTCCGTGCWYNHFSVWTFSAL